MIFLIMLSRNFNLVRESKQIGEYSKYRTVNLSTFLCTNNHDLLKISDSVGVDVLKIFNSERILSNGLFFNMYLELKKVSKGLKKGKTF